MNKNEPITTADHHMSMVEQTFLHSIVRNSIVAGQMFGF